MRAASLLAGAALALTSAWALAQQSPESLLPPGFDRPAPAARPSRAPEASPEPTASESRSPSGATIVSRPVVQALPSGSSGSRAGGGGGGGSAAPTATLPSNLPSLDKILAMSPDELDELLGLKPKEDIPASVRRSMEQVGILSADEGGFSSTALSGQNPGLVQALLARNSGRMVSRWGHILLRRALASRADAPAGMDPADFAAQRASLLVRMGEGDAARAIVQDVDIANFTPALVQAAIDAYLATADVTGVCPVVNFRSGERKDPQWQVLRGICATYSGDSSSGMQQLDRAFFYGVLPRTDLLLAQKYAGAFGKTKRAVNIEWDGVTDMNPFRYALTIGTGLEPPASIMEDADPRYSLVAATAPMLGTPYRAAAADRAGARGVLSSAAMVDLYSQMYDDENVEQAWRDRASQLHDAYVGANPAARLRAMQSLWSGAKGDEARYARLVLTAYAAARLPVSEEQAQAAPDLIAAMLAAGLDGNAMRWLGATEAGSLGWAQLVLADPRGGEIGSGAVDSFVSDDSSEAKRKSAFLVAGLSGLGRISDGTRGSVAEDLGVRFDGETRWTRMIDAAAAADNAQLVALLASLGMQGESWAKMTPRYLYHIVAALNRVGLGAEARMIAAEAVARA